MDYNILVSLLLQGQEPEVIERGIVCNGNELVAYEISIKQKTLIRK